MKIRLLFASIAMLVSFQLQADPISRTEARYLAQLFISIDDASSDEVADAPYYVFSRGVGKGYVIVSGDDSTAPIIGYTDNGDFEYDALPIQLKSMLDSWAKKVNSLKSSPRKVKGQKSAAARLASARRGVDGFKASWEDIPILLATHWHQNSPYNNLCPVMDNGNRTVTGCLATAGSQIAYYFWKDNPDTLLYDTPTYGYGTPVTMSLPKGTPIKYNIMRTQGQGTAEQNLAVARLMYAMGTCSYLTYGSSTGGQGEDTSKALRNQFHIDNEYLSKSSYTQVGWEQMIYANLKTRRPLLYTGANDEGGHAVVLDGYQASTGLYHFNFGWGNQGDGWYTVDDETGMNGFNTYQTACSWPTPRKQNLKGRLIIDQLYLKAAAPVKAVVSNYGTLDYSGLYLYVNTKDVLPASSSLKDLDVIIPVRDSAQVSFIYRPTREQRLWFFLCDANRNLIDSCSMMVQPTVAALHLNSISVNAGDESETVDDYVFQTVNNTTAKVKVNLTNGDGGTYCQPIIRCFVEKYNKETKEWSSGSNKYIDDIIFDEAQTKDTIFTFTKLVPGTYYRAYMDKRARAGVNSDIAFDVNDSIVYFTVREPNLEMQQDGKFVKFSGVWNETVFEEKLNGADVNSLDMTEVEQLDVRPSLANPNALVYTSTPIPNAENIVCNGVCENLVVNTSHEFQPSKGFKAQKAIMVLDRAQAGTWSDVVVPFKAVVPFGMQAKTPSAVNTKTHIVTFDYIREIEPNTIVLCLPDRSGLNTIEAENVEVGTQTDVVAYDSALVASTLQKTVENDVMMLELRGNLLYYSPKEGPVDVPPFTSVLTDYYKNGYRTWQTSLEYHLDIRYRELTTQIDRAYQVLAEQANQARPESVAALKAALNHSEVLFTEYSAESEDEIKEEIAYLKKVIDDFLNPDVDGISLQEISLEQSAAPVEYYNMNGQRITRPVNGVVIIRQGNSVRKAVIR